MLLFIEDTSPHLETTRRPLGGFKKKFSQLAVFILVKGSVILNGADINRLEMAAVAIVIVLGAPILYRCDTKHDIVIMLAFGWAAIEFRYCPSGPCTGDRDVVDDRCGINQSGAV
jgi:hypothetical protein